MLARGSLGNPWRFEKLLGRRHTEPTTEEVAEELRWVIDRAEEHLGTERAGRYLR
jgi:tRNA-dihydrouridine synthase